MEALRNAANAAASYVGYDQTQPTDKAQTGNTLGEIVEDKNTTNSGSTPLGGAAHQHTNNPAHPQSGLEPASGVLGSGTAGQPYDGGNQQGLTTGNSGIGGHNTTSGLAGHGSHNPVSGLTGHNNNNNNNNNNNSNNAASSGLVSGLTGHASHNTTSNLVGHDDRNATSGLTGLDNRNASSGLAGHSSHNASSGLSGHDNRNTTTGLASGPTSGLTGHGSHNPTSGLSSHNNHAGYESTSGPSNNTGYQQSTSRGLGAESNQQGNHYTSTVEAGNPLTSTGLNATHRVHDGSSRDSAHHTGGLSGHGNHGHHGLSGTGAGTGNSSSVSHGILGSDHSAGQSGDRYLFDGTNAPGAGGHRATLVDDFTDANVHHEGSGELNDGTLGSDVSTGKSGLGSAGAGLGHGYTSSGSSHTGQSTTTPTTRSRKPGFERSGSGLSYGNSSHGLNNSGQPRESIGTKLERKGEEALLGAGAGAAGYGATHSHSGQEPLSGHRGSGVGGEPYDLGNTHDGQAYQNTTSGLSNLNLNERRTDGTHHNTTSGLAGGNTPGLTGGNTSGFTGGNTSGTGAGYNGYTGPNSTNESRLSEHGRDFGATAPRNESDVPGSGLASRVAGAPNPSGNLDECVANHHNVHPHGEGAHADGTHKPTFLNYQHDNFGIPVARGD